MPELSAQQKIAIQDYIKSLEDKKDQRLSSQINRWLGIIGLSGAAILSWFWFSLKTQISTEARNEAIAAAENATDLSKIVVARSDAYKAIYTSEASAYANLERSKLLVIDLNKSLDESRTLKEKIRSAKETIESIASLSDANQGIVERISSDPKLLQLIADNVAVPSGMIAAYSSVDSNQPCPIKWRLYDPAVGRVVVGAGVNENKDANGIDLTDHPIGVTGGRENQVLTVAQLPPQSIEISGLAGASRVDRFNAGGKDYPVVGVRTGAIDTGGKGVPVPTMPPFVALYYCIKE